MNSVQLENLSKLHSETLDKLTQSASLLAGICKFNKTKEKQQQQQQPKEEEEEEEETIELENERIQLINQTIQITQQTLINSLKLEPNTIEALKLKINTEQNPPQLTPLEGLTLDIQNDNQNQNQISKEIPLDYDLIYSQLLIKQNSINQWMKHVIEFTPTGTSESGSGSDSERDHITSDSLDAFRDPNGEIDHSEEDDSDFDLSDDVWDGFDEPSSDLDLESYSDNLPENETDEDSDDSIKSDNSITRSSSSSSSSIDSKLNNNKKKKSKTIKSSQKSNNSNLNKDGFFNLAEFESEVNQGEKQMKNKFKKINSQQENSDDEDDEDEMEDVDLFSQYRTGSMDEDGDNDDQVDQNIINLDSVADLRYDDFFAPVKANNQKIIKEKSEKQEKTKTKKDDKGSKDESKKDKKVSINNRKEKSDDDQTDLTKEGRVRFSEKVSVREIPAKNRGLRVSELFGEDDEDDSDNFLSNEDDDDDEEDDDEEDDEEEDDDDGSESNSSGLSQLESNGEDAMSTEGENEVTQEDKTMSRLDSELFDDGFSSNDESDQTDDDQDEDQNEKNLSKHAKKMKILSKEIARLEAENVAKKDWMMKGEASSKDRPENSLLEHGLEFEHVRKIAPAITEERTLDLESLIKKRILEANYDDVIRKRLIDPKAFLPSRLLELSDAQATQSLTEIYEETYKNKKQETETGKKTIDIKDEKLEKEHLEIKEMFENLSNKLDGLSNAHFTPPEPKIKIKTINNLPTVSLESSLPTATGTGTLLAPEEIFNVQKSKHLSIDFDALNHSQKQNLRTQIKKTKKKLNFHINQSNSSSSSKSNKNKNDNNDDDTNKKNKKLSTQDQKEISIEQLNKISSNLNLVNSNTSITLLNKRGAKINNHDDVHSKHRKLVDGSKFKL